MIFLSLTGNKIGMLASSRTVPKRKQAYMPNISNIIMISIGPITAPMSIKVRNKPTAPLVNSTFTCSDIKAISVTEIIPVPIPSINDKSKRSHKELARKYRYMQILWIRMPAKITGFRPNLSDRWPMPKVAMQKLRALTPIIIPTIPTSILRNSYKYIGNNAEMIPCTIDILDNSATHVANKP